MNKIIHISLIMHFFLVACNNNQIRKNTKVETNTLNIRKLPLNSSLESDKFLKEIDKIAITPLPFFVNEGLLISQLIESKNERKNIKVEDNNDLLNNYLSLAEVPKDELFFKIYTKESEDKIKFNFLRRLPPISKSIECLIFASSYEKTYSDFFLLVTYDRTSQKFISIKTICVFEQADDVYYESGFLINENFELKISFQTHYESPRMIREEKLKILKNGEISIIYQNKYAQNSNLIINDYKNDFEEREIPKITKEEKATLFKDFIKAIPEVSLPYNSKEFYSVMQIGSPEIGKPDITLLHHNKLSLDPNVKYFFSNSANDTAFKVIKNDYKEDYYFYPVAKFPIANENMAILYVYQSFCNYNPAIYVRLNTYDSNGNILATKILDRRFYNGVYRFLSSIQIEKDLKINSKQFIQNYEDYEYGDESYKEKAPEINKITYQIKANGFIE